MSYLPSVSTQVPLAPQELELGSLSDYSLQPYVRRYGNWAKSMIDKQHGDPELFLLSYCDEMAKLKLWAIPKLDHVHICTALCGLAEVWLCAVKDKNFDAFPAGPMHQMVHRLAQALCPPLTADFMSAMEARDAAIVLLALSRLQLDPDSCQPGLPDALGFAIINDTGTPTLSPLHEPSALVPSLA